MKSVAAQFPYVFRDPAMGTASLAPLLPLELSTGSASVTAAGLLDSGATVNVLPWSVGNNLGLDWDQQQQTIRLSGNLSAIEARVVIANARVATFPIVRMAFAWVKSDAPPLLLGQVNFFLEFDVCFFRSQGQFEIRPKS